MRWTHAGWWRPFRHRKSLCPEIGGGKRQSIPTMRACDARALFLRPIRNGPAAGEERLEAAAAGPLAAELAEQAGVGQEVAEAVPAEPVAQVARAAVKAVREAPAEPAAVPRAARAAPARDPAASIQTTPTRITSLPSRALSFRHFRRRLAQTSKSLPRSPKAPAALRSSTRTICSAVWLRLDGSRANSMSWATPRPKAPREAATH